MHISFAQTIQPINFTNILPTLYEHNITSPRQPSTINLNKHHFRFTFHTFPRTVPLHFLALNIPLQKPQSHTYVRTQLHDDSANKGSAYSYTRRFVFYEMPFSAKVVVGAAAVVSNFALWKGGVAAEQQQRDKKESVVRDYRRAISAFAKRREVLLSRGRSSRACISTPSSWLFP